MTANSLIALPLPLISAALCAVLAGLLARLDLGVAATSRLLAALFGVFALEASLVALRFGYGVDAFIPLQRVLPLFAGPLLYLACLSLAVTPARLRRQTALHLGAAVAIAVGVELVPRVIAALDAGILASYLGYAVALLAIWRGGPDRLVRARLDLSRRISRWILWAALLLVALSVLDTAIALGFLQGQPQRSIQLISYGSLALIAVLVALLAGLPRLPPRPSPASRPVTAVDGAQIEAAAHALLTQTELYLEPDLSLERLAKRLRLPARTLSAAINERRQMNVSQYVNGFRLAHAARLLTESEASVETVLAASGFLTRSNFYREFQRVYGVTPGAFRKGEPPK